MLDVAYFLLPLCHSLSLRYFFTLFIFSVSIFVFVLFSLSFSTSLSLHFLFLYCFFSISFTFSLRFSYYLSLYSFINSLSFFPFSVTQSSSYSTSACLFVASIFILHFVKLFVFCSVFLLFLWCLYAEWLLFLSILPYCLVSFSPFCLFVFLCAI
jgi:hypothetical protein